MTTTLTRNTVAAIIGIALLVTAFNNYQNPVVWEEDDSDTKFYGGAGINFELQRGMRFNFSKLGDEYISYNEGVMYRLKYDNETELPSIVFTWREWTPMNFTEAIERSYNYSDPRFTEYSFDGYVNTTINDHIFQYQRFDRSTPVENRTGYIGYWNCTNSGRTITLMVENNVDGNLTGLFELFNQTRSTLTCHYPGQTPAGDVDEIELPFDLDTVINIVFMIMLTVGFTFTYMMEGFPNFAHTSYATIGAMVSFFLTRFLNFHPYDTWVFAAFVGGLVGVGLYLGIVRPIRRNGGYQDITLTFTFLIISMVLPQIAYIFNWWARYEVSGGSTVRGYNLRYYDFGYRGIPGIAFTSVAACILLVLWLRHFLTKDRIGLSLRAVAENEDLAGTIGINTYRAHLVSWFISGALSALVGSIMTIRSSVSVAGPDGLIVTVMSGAIFGGVNNVYGAILGGLFVALAQDLLKDLFFIFFGLAVEKWQGLLPMLFLVTSLTLFPNGVLGTDGLNRERIKIAYQKLRERLFK
ncbi:MAG: branched-chain amino acid ABC transporter permease [Candidatus Bathyarchaeota archaeon]|nr:branched-chain amino acid ABC transporter permease [Candidatus Bathyarchaeota archaeon]